MLGSIVLAKPLLHKMLTLRVGELGWMNASLDTLNEHLQQEMKVVVERLDLATCTKRSELHMYTCRVCVVDVLLKFS